jgi:Ca-activated chloride channel family protein
MAVSFDYPYVLFTLVFFIPLFLYDRFSPQKKIVLMVLPKNLQVIRSASQLLFRLFLFFVLFALAGPRWGFGQSEGEYRRMADIVIALDISRSMEVIDEKGEDSRSDAVSRIERGLSIVKAAAETLPEMRFAVTISRNRGIITIPLTWDNGAVLAFLDAAGDASGYSITGRGTNLESLLDTAANAFQASSPSTRVILLVSDGEALSGTVSTALERCNRSGIAVTAIALGSDEGGMVPGEEILSRRDSRLMRTVAGQTGGIYIDGNREDAARALITHLRAFGSPSQEGAASIADARSETGTKAKARWFVFLILAIIAYGTSKFCLLQLGVRN